MFYLNYQFSLFFQKNILIDSIEYVVYFVECRMWFYLMKIMIYYISETSNLLSGLVELEND